MALFDEDNPGKNLANATLWLEASKDSDDGGGGGGCSCAPGCVALALALLALATIPAVLVRCVSTVLFG